MGYCVYSTTCLVATSSNPVMAWGAPKRSLVRLLIDCPMPRTSQGAKPGQTITKDHVSSHWTLMTRTFKRSVILRSWNDGALKVKNDPKQTGAGAYLGYGNVLNTMVILVTLPILGRFKHNSHQSGWKNNLPITNSLSIWGLIPFQNSNYLYVGFWYDLDHVSSDQHLMVSRFRIHVPTCDPNNEAKSGCQKMPSEDETWWCLSRPVEKGLIKEVASSWIVDFCWLPSPFHDTKAIQLSGYLKPPPKYTGHDLMSNRLFSFMSFSNLQNRSIKPSNPQNQQMPEGGSLKPLLGYWKLHASIKENMQHQLIVTLTIRMPWGIFAQHICDPHAPQ